MFSKDTYQKFTTFIILLLILLLTAPFTINYNIPTGFTLTKTITEAYLTWDINAIFVTKAFVTALFVTCFTNDHNFISLTWIILDMMLPILKNSLALMIFVVDDDNWPMAYNAHVICGLWLLLNFLNLAIFVEVVKICRNRYMEHELTEVKKKILAILEMKTSKSNDIETIFGSKEKINVDT